MWGGPEGLVCSLMLMGYLRMEIRTLISDLIIWQGSSKSWPSLKTFVPLADQGREFNWYFSNQIQGMEPLAIFSSDPAELDPFN